MATYLIEHRHSAETCFGAPGPDDEKRSLWTMVGENAKNNNVDIKFFKVNPSEHVFFILLEAENYSDVEKVIGQCKKTGDFIVTPVMDQNFF